MPGAGVSLLPAYMSPILFFGNHSHNYREQRRRSERRTATCTASSRMQSAPRRRTTRPSRCCRASEPNSSFDGLLLQAIPHPAREIGPVAPHEQATPLPPAATGGAPVFLTNPFDPALVVARRPFAERDAAGDSAARRRDCHRSLSVPPWCLLHGDPLATRLRRRSLQIGDLVSERAPLRLYREHLLRAVWATGAAGAGAPTPKRIAYIQRGADHFFFFGFEAAPAGFGGCSAVWRWVSA